MLADLLLGNYKTVAQRLGLTVDASAGRIHGVVDGVPVQTVFGSHATHTYAPLATPATFELSVVTTSLIGRLGHLFSGPHDALGDPAFDKAFSVKTGELARLATLLDAPARTVMLELVDAGLHPAVDAREVHLRRFSQGGSDSEASIERDYHEAARLAQVISASFAKAP